MNHNKENNVIFQKMINNIDGSIRGYYFFVPKNHNFNSACVKICKGLWDPKKFCWKIEACFVDKCRELIKYWFGLDSEILN